MYPHAVDDIGERSYRGQDRQSNAPVSTRLTGADSVIKRNGFVAAPKSLSVIICGYTLDRWDAISDAIQSLRSQTVAPEEIIFVSDYNQALFERASEEFHGVKVLPNCLSQGLSGARNTGVGAAGFDVIAFLDDDAAAAPSWVERLMTAYSEQGVIGVGGGVLPDWRAARPSWLPEEFLWVVGCSYRGQPASRAEVRNAIGANMSFRRDVFSAVGYFDPTVGRFGADAAGCEETEFSIRARRGFPQSRILLEPDAVCHHIVGPERVTNAYFRRRCRAEGRSKALVSRLSGADAALESERTYVRSVLPRGVLRGLSDLARGDRSGAARAAAIVEGLTLTVLSYLGARVSIFVRRGRANLASGS